MHFNYGSSIKYHHDLIGTNSRLDELQAAFLRIKLKYLDGWNRIRNQQASLYHDMLDNNNLTIQKIPDYAYSSRPIRSDLFGDDTGCPQFSSEWLTKCGRDEEQLRQGIATATQIEQK